MADKPVDPTTLNSGMEAFADFCTASATSEAKASILAEILKGMSEPDAYQLGRSWVEHAVLHKGITEASAAKARLRLSKMLLAEFSVVLPTVNPVKSPEAVKAAAKREETKKAEKAKPALSKEAQEAQEAVEAAKAAAAAIKAKEEAAKAAAKEEAKLLKKSCKEAIDLLELADLKKVREMLTQLLTPPSKPSK